MMGANTYIGNAPNFAVKCIAERAGIKMPSFFGYMGYSMVILMPIFDSDCGLLPLISSLSTIRRRAPTTATMPNPSSRSGRSPNWIQAEDMPITGFSNEASPVVPA